MVLPTSGPISISAINTEFGRGNNLAAYRNTFWFKPSTGGGGYFTATNLGMDQFYGTTPYIIINVYGTVYDFRLYNSVIAAGWNGSGAVAVICNVYGYILSSWTGSYAFLTGGYPAGSYINITVHGGGLIAGKGGQGGTGATWVVDWPNLLPGQPGGPSLGLETSVYLYNYGVIGGGGGGGGAGGISNGDQNPPWDASSGGGGGGASYGPGGSVDNNGASLGRFGQPGQSGDVYSGGAGGSPGNDQVGSGGRGGDLGQPGQQGFPALSRGPTQGGPGGGAGRGIQNVAFIQLGSYTGDVRGGTDFVIFPNGSADASWNLWAENPKLIESSVDIVHTSAAPGPYLWDQYTESYGGVGLHRVDYVNEYTRRAVFLSEANAPVNYYSVFVFYVDGSNGVRTVTRFGVTHNYYYFDPNDTGPNPQ